MWVEYKTSTFMILTKISGPNSSTYLINYAYLSGVCVLKKIEVCAQYMLIVTYLG